MSVGQKLVALRGNRTQASVAKELGICPSALGMYERDERNPRDEIKVRISNYYGISIQELFYPLEITNCENPKGENRR